MHYSTESIIASSECTTIKTRWLAKCDIKVLLLIKKLKTCLKFVKLVSELKKLFKSWIFDGWMNHEYLHMQ